MKEIFKFKKFKSKYLYSSFIISVVISGAFLPFSEWHTSSEISDSDFFNLLDRSNEDLQPIIEAANKYDYDSAAQLWWDYLLERNFTYHNTLEASSSLASANTILAHKFDYSGEMHQIIGENKMMYGVPWNDINWHVNLHSSSNEWVYLLNRHYWGPTLAQAYLNNSNEVYAREWVFCVTDWIEDEKPGANRFSWRALDTAGRIDRMIQPFLVFMNTSFVTARFVLDFCKSIVEQTRFVTDFHTLHANKLASCAAGMLRGRAFLPEITESTFWEGEAWECFQDLVDEDIYSDGSSREGSTGYHSANLDAMTEGFEISDYYDYITPIGNLLETYYKMVYFQLQIRSNDFIIFNFGDAGARGNLASVTAAAPYCMDYEKYDELIYFNTTGGLTGLGVVPQTHISFNERGYYISRSDWTPDGFSSMIDAGPYGTGHEHDDVLSFMASAYGKRFIIDPGMAAYGGDEVAKFQHTAWAHNQFIIDNNPIDGVSVENPSWAAGTYGTALRGTHNFWEADASRELVFSPRGYWMVNDFYEGEGSHSLDLVYQLDESNMTEISPYVQKTNFTNEANMNFGLFAPWSSNISILGGEGTGDLEHIAKISDRLNGVWWPGTALLYKAEINGPSCWNTVLYPTPANSTFNTTFIPLPITIGGQTTLFNESFSTPGIAMAVNTPEGWDIHISLRNSQTIEINDPRFQSINFTGKQCVISFKNNSQSVESVFSSDIESLIVNGTTIITKISSQIFSSIDKFTIHSDSVIPITMNTTTNYPYLYEENALTIGGYEL